MIAGPTSTPVTAQALPCGPASGAASGAATDLTSGTAAADPLAALFQALMQTYSAGSVDTSTVATPVAEEQELAELADPALLVPPAPDFSPVALLQHLDATELLQTALDPAQGSKEATANAVSGLSVATPLILPRTGNPPVAAFEVGTGTPDSAPLPPAATSTLPTLPAVRPADIAPQSGKEFAVRGNFGQAKTDASPKRLGGKPEDGARTVAPAISTPVMAAPQKSPPAAPASPETATALAALFKDALAPDTEPAVVAPATVATPARPSGASEALRDLPQPGPIELVAASESTRPKAGVSTAAFVATEQPQGPAALEATRTAPVAGEFGATPVLQHTATIESGGLYRSAIAAHPAAPSFPAELSSELRLLVKGGIQYAELSMNPLELGPIRIELSVSGQTADITFTAASAVTRDGIAQSLPQLRELLGSQGIGLGQTSVGAEAQGQKHAAQEGSSSKNPLTGAQHGQSFAAPSSMPMAHATTRGIGLLDLYA